MQRKTLTSLVYKKEVTKMDQLDIKRPKIKDGGDIWNI